MTGCAGLRVSAYVVSITADNCLRGFHGCLCCAAAAWRNLAALRPWQQFLFSTERLKLMTWNLGRARLGGDELARAEDLPHIMNVIEREKPDVVALQELASGKQLEMLARRLRGAYRGRASGRRARTVLLVRRRHTITETFELRTRNGRRAPALEFKRARIAEPITIVGVHADPFDARARRMFIEDLVAQTRPRKGLVFLIGDFNLDVAGDGRRGGDRASLTDRLAHDAESYSLLARHFVDAGKSAGATALLERRLDYVFARPRTVAPVRARTLDAAVGEMDHRALVVLTDLRAKPRMQLLPEARSTGTLER